MLRDVNIVMNLPDSWNPETPSYHDSVASEFGKASWEWETAGTQFHTHARYLMNDEEIPPAKYDAFREFLDQVRYHDLQEVLLRKEERPVADAQPN